jgi:REP element-mobilizing transposase RayT
MEGGIQHVWARGNGRRRIYLDEDDIRIYLALFGREILRRGWRCLGYCLMSNHMHLLIETPEANLGRGMQRFHSRFARIFNERHAEPGHVFETRYGNELIKTEGHLLNVVGYVAANPVEAGLCERPEQWPWSSHRDILDERPPAWLDVERLFFHLSEWGPDPCKVYRELVARRLRTPANQIDVKFPLRGLTL